MAKKTNRQNIASGSKRTEREQGYSSDGEKIIWRFDRIDRAGKFAFDLDRKDFLHYEVMEKIINYSSMTWAEVKRQTHDGGKSKHHMLSVDSLSDDAIERLEAKHLCEYSDSIFSLALRNRLRIVGIRDKEFFYVLWYDPNHEICPSKLKNT